MDCSLPGSSVHGILQARILEWVAFPFSRGSFQPKDWTQVSCIAGRFFTNWATREALMDIMLGEISSSQKDKYCMISHMWGFKTARCVVWTVVTRGGKQNGEAGLDEDKSYRCERWHSSADALWNNASAPNPAEHPGVSSKDSADNAGDSGSIPGLGRLTWGRTWKPTLLFLPGKFHGQRSLVWATIHEVTKSRTWLRD